MTNNEKKSVVDLRERKRDFKRLFLDEQRYIRAALERERECRREHMPEAEDVQPIEGVQRSIEAAQVALNVQILGMAQTVDAWNPEDEPQEPAEQDSTESAPPARR